MRCIRFGVVLLALAGSTLQSAQDAIRNQAEVPAAALATVEKLLPGYVFASAKKLTGTEAGTRYEINARLEQEIHRFIVSDDGKLIERTHMNPRLEDAPAPVKEAILRASGGGQPDGVIKTMPVGGETYYKVRVTRNVTADGTVSPWRFPARMVVLKDEEITPIVRGAVEKLKPGASIERVEKLVGTDPIYGMDNVEFNIKQNGRPFRVIVATDGSLREEWDLGVKLDDTPEPVKRVIEKATSGGDREPDNVIKVSPVGKTPYYTYRLTRSLREDGSVITTKK
jgi:hypothetical protein